jgi:FkbM family methyltransferase
MHPPQLAEPILVYGAGSKGKQVATFLLAQGYDVIGMADTTAKEHQIWNNLPIRPLTDWHKERSLRGTTLVVAIHNYHVDMTKLLQELSHIGASRVINPVEFQMMFHEHFPSAYWLSGPDVYQEQQGNIEAVFSLLADERSRDLLCRIVEFRLTGHYAALPKASPEDQYCPADLPRWSEPLRIIDAGAFDGDTLRSLKRQGYAFEQIAAFEPDPENFTRLSRCVEALGGGICLPCGLAQSSRQAHFDAAGTGSSRISDLGTQMIQCVSIDEALPSYRPTLIKMDIEGAEPDALQGAAKTIATTRPALAISIYHDPAHLWQLPLLIHSWQLDYRFHLRMHGESSFDTVLYALP